MLTEVLSQNWYLAVHWSLLHKINFGSLIPMTWYCEGVLTCIMQYHNNYPDGGSVMHSF